MLANDITSETGVGGKYNEPDFLRFKPKMKTPLGNTRTPLFLYQAFRGEKWDSSPSVTSLVGKICMIAHMEGILLLFLIRGYYCLELPLLACLLACGVSDVALEKFGLLYFFPGSNLGMKSFLGKEGRDWAAAENNGEVCWLCQGVIRLVTSLIRARCVVVGCWYRP